MNRWLSSLLLSVVFLLLGVLAGAAPGLEKATFAGGCFWCLEFAFDRTPGVVKVTAGYVGGTQKNPTYATFAAGGYAEGVEVLYDASKVSYSQLLDVFWSQIDPTDPGGQFGDRGEQYRTIIFYQNPGQKRLAESSKAALKQSGKYGKSIITEILPLTNFYHAEEAQQDFYIKNPIQYRLYLERSGRNY